MPQKKPAAKNAAPGKAAKTNKAARNQGSVRKSAPVTGSGKKVAKKAPAPKAAAKKTPAKKAPAPKAPAKKLRSAGKPAPAKKAALSKKAPGKAAASKGVKETAARKPAAKPEPVKKAPAAKEAPASLKEAGRRGGPDRGTVRLEAPPPPKPGKATSRYSVGDKVVHPQHGAATIARRIKREFGGVVRDYYVLDISTESLTVMVPVEKVDQVVRSVISKTQSRNVLASLKEEPQEAGANWSRWYKVLTEKMYSGDIFQVAEVVRDLSFAQQTKGISPALKRMLSKARMTLISELSFSLEEDEEEATKRLDKALPRIETALAAIE
ncbi:MAG TPA: CarD family transcriptional regulator [Acidimicrobiia bacterium]|nr:CarD family transcriptional regulator [Acidimicrobiia bacterium]